MTPDRLNETAPRFGPDVMLRNPAFIHPTACLYGKVTMEEGASAWIHMAVRAETQEVVVGRFTNLQDFVMVHVGYDTPTVIGAYCSIAHHCTIHGCRIGDNCLIGINSTVMDGAVIGDNCVIGGHTLITEGTVVPDNSVVVGTPGRVIKARNSFVANRANALLYHRNALAYARGDHRAWTGPDYDAEWPQVMARIEADFAARYDAAGID